MTTVARTPEAQRLLGLVADHMLAYGVAGLSLSQVAKAIGSNNRMLLYYFKTKDGLFLAALADAYERMPGGSRIIGVLQEPGDLAAHLCDAWRLLRAPENVPYIRLFFEAFAMSVRDPAGRRERLRQVSANWPRHIHDAFVQHGYSDRQADIAAAQLLAVWRGLQFALLEDVDTATLDATHDRVVEALFA